VVIDQIDIGDVLTFKLEDHAPVAGDRHRPLARTVATQGMEPRTGSAMSDGTEAVARAARTARNRFACWAETPLVSPREYSRSSPLWRRRRIIAINVTHHITLVTYV
jgi:hypothetical protein